jgi:hypothetical protein
MESGVCSVTKVSMMSLNTSKLVQRSSGASTVRLCGTKQISRPEDVDWPPRHERMDQTKLRTRARIASAGLCRLCGSSCVIELVAMGSISNDDPELCLPFPAAICQQ